MKSEPDRAISLDCTREEIEQLQALAKSTTAGIWRSKRAKALLGTIQGVSAERLMYQVRVPVVSIRKCIRSFARQRMAYFDQPERPPTAREAAVEKMLALLDHPPPVSSDAWDNFTLRYIGTHFSARNLKMIRDMVSAQPEPSITAIAREMCIRLKLYGANGKPRFAIARDILKRMAMDNIIDFPLNYRTAHSKERPPPKTVLPSAEIPETLSLSSISVTVSLVECAEEALAWKAMIHHYHYISGHRLFGPQLRYLVYARSNRAAEPSAGAEVPLAALSFSPCAWRVSCRDDYIGWNDRQRIANLPLVINNSRFLILPWVKIPNLASHILGAAARQAPHDWEARYGRRPVLLETFVEQDRFNGTCYRAANWIEIGTTVGYSLHGRKKRRTQAPRSVFLLPLDKRFRQILCHAPPES